MRRRVVPLLLLVCAVPVAVWLATREGGSPDSGEEIGRAREEAEPVPPMLRGAADAAVADPQPPTPSGAGAAATTDAVDGESLPEEPLPAAAEEAAETGPAAVHVRVVDGDGRPRPGLTIRLNAKIDGTFRLTHRVRLDENGEARLEDLVPGRAYVWIEDGKGHRSRGIDLEAGRTTAVEAVVPVGAVVTGTVRHVEKGVLPGIRVQLEVKEQGGTATFITRSDEEGRYRLEGVPPGTHGVSLRGMTIGFSLRPRAQVTVQDGETCEQDLVLGRMTIEGRVRDAVTGRPLPEVHVDVAGTYAPTATDASGTFQVLDLPPGRYRVWFRKDGYQGKGSDEVEVAEGIVARVEIDLEPAAVLVLRLRTPEGRAVTGRIRVEYEARGTKRHSSTTWCTTDGLGVARYERILPGSYRVKVSLEGYDIDAVRAQVGSDETPVDVVCRPQATDSSPTLRGVVRDAHTCDPIPGVTIRTQRGMGETAVTNGEGAYAFLRLAGRGLRLIVSKDGYGIRFLRGVEAQEGEETVLDIELTPAAVLHLWLTDARGEPVVGGLTLSIHPKERDGGGTQVGTGVTADAEGHAVYRQIVPGDYQLLVIDEKAGQGRAEAVITPGENAVRIRLE